MLERVEDIYCLYQDIESGKIVENDMEYHDQVAKVLTNNYDLAYKCFTTCSVGFYMWFSKNYLAEIVNILYHHRKKALLIALKDHLLSLVDGNPYDPRIDSIGSIYHFVYKVLS